MNLPVYEAIGFQAILDKGGHSKPWVVMVNIKGSPKPYVVKLYKLADIEARNKMTAEVLGNVLAKEFGLNALDAAIINFSEAFKLTLSGDCEEILSVMDERPKFGCQFLEGANLYNPETKRSDTEKLIDPALLFAYDHFICNRDRTKNKPNLLVKGGEGYLIDHEMALEIDDHHFMFDKNLSIDSRYKHHLFYDHLKKKRGDKKHIFAEFELYLRDLNLNRLEPYFLQLEQMGFKTQKKRILEYWNKIKDNSTIFVKILTNSIV